MANLYRVLAKVVLVVAFAHPALSFGISYAMIDDVGRAMDSMGPDTRSRFGESMRTLDRFGDYQLANATLEMVRNCAYLLAASAVLHVAAQSLTRGEAEAGAVSSARADVAS